MEAKVIIVNPIPASPGWYAYTKDWEERYGSSWGRTPEEALENHKEWMEFKDESN